MHVIELYKMERERLVDFNGDYTEIQLECANLDAKQSKVRR